MAGEKQKIITNLWFDRQAEEAANFYASLFRNSKVGDISHYTKAGFEIHHMPEGTVLTVDFELAGQRFIALNGGPVFKFTPAISFLITCDTKNEVDVLWQRLSSGGSSLMELGAYPFSERYGWIQDKYGLSWQIIFSGERKIGQKITPTLMFTGENQGEAEAAINFFKSTFHSSRVGDILRYSRGEEPDQEGTIKHAGFILEDQQFAAMDSARSHDFTFNEAISLMVECENQREIDYYWDGLLRGGGKESVCGWLKDKFGVSWQVTPALLSKMLKDPDIKKVESVTNSYLKMKKFDIKELIKAYEE